MSTDNTPTRPEAISDKPRTPRAPQVVGVNGLPPTAAPVHDINGNVLGAPKEPKQ